MNARFYRGLEVDGILRPKGKVRLDWFPAIKEVPILAVSASVAPEDLKELLAAGFAAFIHKPVLWTQLSEKLETYLALDWCYTKAEEAQEENIFDINELTPPPMGELALLNELAMMGDMAAIISHTERIKRLDLKYGLFTRRLGKLAGNFEDRQIRILLQQYIKGRL